jgi:cyclase
MCSDPGGAGHSADCLRVLTEGGTQAALGAGIFHDGSWPVADVKRYLRDHGVEVRPC